jgi:hypothetical protein
MEQKVGSFTPPNSIRSIQLVGRSLRKRPRMQRSEFAVQIAVPALRP